MKLVEKQEMITKKNITNTTVDRVFNIHLGIDIGHGNTKIAVRKLNKKTNKDDWYFTKFGSYVTIASSPKDYINFMTNDYLYDVISFEESTIKYLYGDVVMRENKVSVCQRGKPFYVSQAYRVLIAASIDTVIKNVVGEDAEKIEINSLGLGLPLTYVRIIDIVNTIKNFFIRENDYYIFKYKRNETTYTIKINNLMLFSQGAGALETPELSKRVKNYRTYGVIDIGQYTTDYFLFKDGVVVLDSVGTEEHGTYEIVNEIRSALQEERGTLVNETTCREHLLDERFIDIRYSKLILILESVKSKWVNYLSDIEIFFLIGGGAELLRDIDLSIVSSNIEIVENAEFLNAKGYTYID
jgi:hypothetical protein